MRSFGSRLIVFSKPGSDSPTNLPPFSFVNLVDLKRVLRFDELFLELENICQHTFCIGEIDSPVGIEINEVDNVARSLIACFRMLPQGDVNRYLQKLECHFARCDHELVALVSSGLEL